MAISTGQAAANALARWLAQELTPDVEVLARWPTGETLKVNANSRVKTVSVTKVGTRRRIDADVPMQPLFVNAQNLSAGKALFPIGAFIQPLQIDLWATYDEDRDDLIAQCDDALSAGTDRTLGQYSDDPVRDGIVLPLLPENGYAGALDYWFDEVTVDDDPSTIAQAEFRATYSGDARGPLARLREVPLLSSIALKLRTLESTPVQPAPPYDTATLTATNTGIVVTRGQSSS